MHNNVFKDDLNFFQNTFLAGNGQLIKTDGHIGSQKQNHKYFKREEIGYNTDGSKKYKYFYKDANGKVFTNTKSPEEMSKESKEKSKKVEITVGTAVSHNGKVFKVKELYSSKEGTQMAKIKNGDEILEVKRSGLKPTKDEKPQINFKKE